MKSASLILACLALLIALGWGAVEVILVGQSEHDSKAVCQPSSATKEWPSVDWIQADPMGIWVYNSEVGQVELRVPRMEKEFASAFETKMRYRLICEKPDYQCFVEPEGGLKKQLGVRALKPPFALVEYDRRPDILYPVQFFPFGNLDQNDLITRAQPIRFCGLKLNKEAVKFSFFGQRLVAAADEVGLVAVWNLGPFRGGMLQDAAKGPDEVWKFAANGDLIPGSCGETAKALALRTAFYEDSLLVHYDFAQSSGFKKYQLSPTLQPEDPGVIVRAGLTQLKQSGQEPIYGTDVKTAELLTLTGAPPEVWQPTGWKGKRTTFFNFSAAGPEAFLLVTASEFLSRLSIQVLAKDIVYNVPVTDFRLRRKEVPELHLYKQQEALIYFQRNLNTGYRLASLECSSGPLGSNQTKQ